MKTLFLLFGLSGFAASPILNSTPSTHSGSNEPVVISANNQHRSGNIRAIEFKSQRYCRVEMPADFEFDVKFTLVSAQVYFSGAGFPEVRSASIQDNSLLPLKPLVDKCVPGSLVIFDDIKVKGPDGEIRSIDGVTYRLY